LLTVQPLLALGILAMGMTDPATDPLRTSALAALVAFLSASQDVVSDAWRTDILSEAERGFGVANFVTGYRLGILASSPIALTLSDTIGWQRTYWVMAALMLVGVVATLLAPEPEGRAPRNLRDAVVLPFTDYFKRNGAIAVLVFLMLYKLGEAFAGPAIVNPFFSELGFTNTEIGWISKVPSLIASIAGGLLGGLLMVKLGMRKSLYIFGALQALTNLTYLVLALVGKNYAVLATAISIDNMCGGMATTALGAYQMALCNKRFSATQFALLSALANLGGRMLTATSGYLAEWMGWAGFFGLTVVLALPALVLLSFLPEGIAAPQVEEEPASEAAPATPAPAVAR